MSDIPSSTQSPGAPSEGGAPPGPPKPNAQATGPTGATMPVANQGAEAKALATLSVFVNGLQKLITQFPVGSEAWKDTQKALGMLGKHVPPGAVSQGIQMSEAQRGLMQQRQMQMQQTAQRASQPAGGGAPPPPTPGMG